MPEQLPKTISMSTTPETLADFIEANADCFHVDNGTFSIRKGRERLLRISLQSMFAEDHLLTAGENKCSILIPGHHYTLTLQDFNFPANDMTLKAADGSICSVTMLSFINAFSRADVPAYAIDPQLPKKDEQCPLLKANRTQ